MTRNMYYGEDYKKLPEYNTEAGVGIEVRPDVYLFTDQIANLIFIGYPEDSEFVIIDTGMPRRAEAVVQAAKERFGEDARAKAIILTHGHFDHVGTVIELIEEWGTPVYAHPLEFPFLTGEIPCQTADLSYEDGLMEKMASVFPTDSINIAHSLQPLPENGEVPELHDFEWVHTPGHTPGHVALFRAADCLLISGDAFVTTKQDDFFNVDFEKVELAGPPAYLTPNWEEAGESVQKLQDLQPQCVIAGHGQPVEGDALEIGLEHLLENWHAVAVKTH